MSPGIADQLLLLIDEIEELTMEIFMAVQSQTPSENLVEMLIKKVGCPSSFKSKEKHN